MLELQHLEHKAICFYIIKKTVYINLNQVNKLRNLN